MGVVQQAVADRVGRGRLAEVVVPLGGRQLARDDGRMGAIAILQDLEEVAALRILDRRQPPVVDDEDIEAGQLGEQADVGADRKSARLNSSHLVISYAVFCLKKKKLQEMEASESVDEILD